MSVLNAKSKLQNTVYQLPETKHCIAPMFSYLKLSKYKKL